ncbi:MULTISPECIES: ribosome biogenesis/translation initiation ATPase RLI [Metallosphaera]|uniref:ABC transporter related protein n=3 Tax=Metallosphaera TaxID=41980 RepID=A4YIZ4_METS5|nr:MULTISPECIES: ribosome biogenesis/translation initiation ATPase RLI [Metallosphaera]ABP96396.1 ABC transporter related protein [Metallosphaera sedula DSM 5348]AIM28379.1 ABC transporter related protein [Metallosphaera sedula]AKV75170.1 ATPase [Metallosphaera sedula]AKV77406.1 ATPase [Metallosphaera sedula]AKV79658.1 ATPase [Metallosphaera sedula]
MRVAVINYDSCKPDKCSIECVRFCPINRAGSKAIEIDQSKLGKPVVYEETCIGCNICVKKCPFEAISIVNVPDNFSKEIIHRYGTNGFELFGLPILKSGYVIGLLGKNGAGKTTILKILSGEIIPNFGEVEKQPSIDTVLQKFKGKELFSYFYDLYNKKLRVVHKIQYVEYASRLLKGEVSQLLRKVDERGKLDEIRELLFMNSIWNKEISTLSGGELQKTLIAAALAREANVYAIDEPSSYLDVRERINVAKGIRELTKGKYVVTVDHDLIVLDYIADFVSIIYGESGVYGKVSKTYSTRVGINNFLNGYLPAENMRVMDHKIQFYLKDVTDLDLAKNSAEKVRWSNITKTLGDFSLNTEQGFAREGEVIGIVGPNGIGKTTFIRILVGEIEPDSGSIVPTGLTLSYKPQRIVPDYEGTVREYLESVSKDILSTSSWFYTEVTRRLRLHKLLDSNVKDLSGGELQKLYVAGALAKEAHIYLLDEPSSYLDVEERYVVAKAIKRITRERKSVSFVVDHDLAIHDYIADRLIVFTGTPGKSGHASEPLSLSKGMNTFLKEIGLTFRRDAESGRPRANKIGSYLDRLQRERNEYYSTETVAD